MVQLLRAVVTLAEGLGLVHRMRISANNHCNSSSRDSDALFCPQWALHAPGSQTYLQTKHSFT